MRTAQCTIRTTLRHIGLAHSRVNAAFGEIWQKVLSQRVSAILLRVRPVHHSTVRYTHYNIYSTVDALCFHFSA